MLLTQNDTFSFLRFMALSLSIAVHGLAIAAINPAVKPPSLQLTQTAAYSPITVVMTTPAPVTKKQPSKIKQNKAHTPLPTTQKTVAITPVRKQTPQIIATQKTNSKKIKSHKEEKPPTIATKKKTQSQKVVSSEGLHKQIIVTQPSFKEPPTPPQYPSLARKRQQQGIVWLDIVINSEGLQEKVTITKSSGFSSLDDSALKAVSGWKFKPHLISGQSVTATIRVPIEFSLTL